MEDMGDGAGQISVSEGKSRQQWFRGRKQEGFV